MKDNKIVNVVDIESTCWEDNHNPPAGQHSEIIEIGIVEVDLLTGGRRNKRSIIVTPEYSKVSDFCTELTTITQEEVDQNGIPFETALDILRQQYKTHRRTWVSWGDYDRNMFMRQCRETGTRYPFGPRHVNLKTVVSMLQNPRKEQGVSPTLARLCLEFYGTKHRGDDDAYNIAAILLETKRTLKN